MGVKEGEVGVNEGEVGVKEGEVGVKEGETGAQCRPPSVICAVWVVGFEITRMIRASCQTHSVQSYPIVTCPMHFALLLCSASQACTECCLEVNAVKRLTPVQTMTGCCMPRAVNSHCVSQSSAGVAWTEHRATQGTSKILQILVWSFLWSPMFPPFCPVSWQVKFVWRGFSHPVHVAGFPTAAPQPVRPRGSEVPPCPSPSLPADREVISRLPDPNVIRLRHLASALHQPKTEHRGCGDLLISTPRVVLQHVREIEQVAAAGGDVGVNEGEVGKKEGEVGVNEGEVGVNEGEVGVNEGEVGVNEGEVGKKEGEVGVNEGEVGKKEGEVGVNEGEVGKKEGEVGVHEGEVGVNEGEVGVKEGKWV